MTVAELQGAVGEPTPWGVVAPWCDADLSAGRWACASCGVDVFRDRFVFAGHLLQRGRHRVVWMCSRCRRPHGRSGS